MFVLEKYDYVYQVWSLSSESTALSSDGNECRMYQATINTFLFHLTSQQSFISVENMLYRITFTKLNLILNKAVKCFTTIHNTHRVSKLLTL